MNRDCRNCVYGEAAMGILPIEDDDVMECNWMPATPLPYSWRGVRTEITMVHPADARECEAFEPRPRSGNETDDEGPAKKA